jgi:uncharacterized membrane protein
MVNTWLHVIALVVFVGAVLALWLVFFPALSAVESYDRRTSLLARGLKFYNPLQVGALGIVLFTGAFQLTELKAAYRDQFVQQIGYALAVKLSFAFLLVIFSVYQSMGIAHRFVKRYEAGERVSESELGAVVRRLKIAAGCILALAVATVWAGLRLHG